MRSVRLRPPLSALVTLLTLGALAPVSLPAQATTGAVAGRVVARSDSVSTVAAGATVSIAGSNEHTTTDADGRFLLARVPVGDVVLRVRLMGYRGVDRPVHVAVADTSRVEIALDPDAQRLAPVRSDAPAAEVERFTSRPSVGEVALTARAMAGVPRLGEADVMRVAQLLPGVVARNDFNTGLNVRGGEADQNLVLLDGYPIYNPFHLGGLFSTFMDATVGGIDLLTAAFPARYGGRLSSVLDVQSAEETRSGVNGSAEISALGASAKAGSIISQGRGSWSVAARRTYMDAASRLFTRQLFPYHFRDLQGRLTYSFPTGTSVAATLYSGRDVLDLNLATYDTSAASAGASQGSWGIDWGNRVIGVSVTQEAGAATLEQRLSTSEFSTLLDVGDGAFAQRNLIRDLRAAGSALWRGRAHDVSGGYEVAAYDVRYASGSSSTGSAEFDILQQPRTGALWLSDVWRLSPRWIVEPGLRGEALTGAGWTGLSPRLSAKFFVSPDLALTAAAGRVTQFTHSMAGDGPLRYFDIWLASDSTLPVATGWHYVLGVQRRIHDAGWLQAEAYVKRYDRVLEANWSEDPQRRGDEFFAVQGLSYGADLFARWQPSSTLSGWLAYSYGVSWRGSGGSRWAPGHDRRHTVNLVATWRLAKYRVGGRFGFGSGTPYTAIIGEVARRVYDPSRDAWDTGHAPILQESLGGARNGARFPAMQRLDLDVSRDFRVRGVTATPFLSVANAYNARNVFVYLYDYSRDGPTRRAISQFPIVPSAGVRIAF